MLPIKNQNKFDIVAIQGMTIAELKEELSKTLTVTADYLMYIARIWRELEYRGEDLGSLRHGMMAYIPLIANKQLDARVVVNYAGKKTLLSYMAKLPLEQQRQIIDKGTMELVIIDENKNRLIKEVNISTMTSSQVYQAFGEGKIKSPDEQYKLILARQKTRDKLASTKAKTYRMTKNIRKEGDNLVVAGKYGISIKELKRYLKEENEL